MASLDNPKKARLVVAAVAVQAAVAAVTIRDINHRPKEAVRGPKMLWRLVGGANTLGSVAYWVLGRKRSVGGGKAVLVNQES
jgi:hypothetical protein